MTTPRRPRAARPAVRRPRAARAPGAARTAAPRASRPVRTPPAPAAARSGSPFTTRAAILVLVVCTLVVSAALPVREYLAQRAEISAMEQQQSAARARVAELEKAKVELQDPAYITAEARRRLHMAKPGDVTYLVIPPSAAPATPTAAGSAPATATAPRPDAPWWSQVWGGVAAADRPSARP